MKKFLVSTSFIVLSYSFFAIAQVVVDPNQEFLKLLGDSIGQFKTMGTLALIGLSVQILIKFLNTSWFGSLFSKLEGSTKLLIVSGLGIVGSVIALMLPPNNQTFLVSLTNGAVLTALMVFANQVYKQFSTPKV